MDQELYDVAQGIRGALAKYQTENNLSFVEDTHTYYIKDKSGNIISNMPSVSTVLESFYTPFNAKATRAFKNCNGDPNKEAALLKEWSDSGDYAANKGSRVHYMLEKNLIESYGNFKQVRQPIFTCDKQQIIFGDNMIKSGMEFINLMHSRGAIMLDTEIIMGSLSLGYFGQPDNTWLIRTQDGRIGIIITDWKTNKPKNFQVHSYTKKMKAPFKAYPDTALSHYYVQIPLYGKLLLNMLENTIYKNVPLLGGVVVLLKDEGGFEEFKIPKDVVDTVKALNMKKYIK